MTQSTSTTQAEITDEQRQLLKKGVTQCVENFTKDQNMIKNDKTGFVILDKACEYLFGGEGNKQDEVKDENNYAGLKQMWETFKTAAREIAKFAAKFLKDLKNAHLKLATKKKIAEVCRQFKKLLQSTSKKLQAYRLDINKMIATFNNIIELLIPPEDVCEDLETLSRKEKLKQINEFATENKEELSEKLTDLSQQMKENKNKQALHREVEKWGMMQGNINKVIALVKEDEQEFRSRMKKLAAVACVLGAVLCGVLAFTGAGAIGAFFGLGAKLAKVVVAVSVVSCLGLSGMAVLLFTVPEFGDMLKIGKDKTIDTISHGLRRIAEQSDRMETMLHQLYKQWVEVMDKDPKASYKTWGKKVRATGLLKKLHETKTGLQQLVTSIKETEIVCEEQLSEYTEKIYKPLLDLYL